MLSNNMESALNEQIRIEAESSQIYLAMASWAEVKGLEGVAEFLYDASDEERMHMLKLVKYINERGGHAKVSKLTAPDVEFGSLKEMFGAGTAAVVSPISGFGFKNVDYELPKLDDTYASYLKKRITDIQTNKADDPFGGNNYVERSKKFRQFYREEFKQLSEIVLFLRSEKNAPPYCPHPQSRRPGQTH